MARRAPLLSNALALFEEHLIAADGNEVQVYAHDAVDPLDHTTAKWRIEILRAKDSATQASELKAHLAALEANLANPVNEIPANQDLKTSGSASTEHQDHHNGA